MIAAVQKIPETAAVTHAKNKNSFENEALQISFLKILLSGSSSDVM